MNKEMTIHVQADELGDEYTQADKEHAMFRCKLVNDGVVVESFLRAGDSANDVQSGLDMFQWPDGKWEIEDA